MARRSKTPLRRQLQHRHSRAGAQKRRLIRIMKPVHTLRVAKNQQLALPMAAARRLPERRSWKERALCAKERNERSASTRACMQEESIPRRRFFLSFFLQFYSLLVRTTGHDGSNKFCGILNGLNIFVFLTESY